MTARLPDIQTLIQAGINPKNGSPIRMSANGCQKTNIKKSLRIIDEQDAVNRYTWYNIPCNLTSQELERLIYYKGQLVFFYLESGDEFYFMPYTLDGTIDFYGRFNSVHPVPMSSGGKENEKENSPLASYLATIKLNCVYGIVDEEYTYEEAKVSGVLLHDYTKQLSQTIIPRVEINDPILDVMSECVPYMSTSLLAGTGIKGMRVNDADQEQNVVIASKQMKDNALNQMPWIPVVGNLEFQELTDGQVAKSEEFMLAMQSLDNYRLSTYGLDNGGLFEKKAHELQSENDMNNANVSLVLEDGLKIRQNFCNIVNSIWNLGLWCEISENVSQADVNQDGLTYDDDSEGGMTGVDTEGGE